ncbi:MAG: alpha/beta hydrolase [Halieaceae bacterium]|jgi:alpha-beta hydrolase superfamily lysophospholipase|nr:alpha/beta hydrolase [Halieaceae bacterium]
MTTTPQEFTFSSEADGLTIHAYRWSPTVAPKAVVLIAHGLAEYGLRYDRFAQALCLAGYQTYAIDHRGHGKSIDNVGLSSFGAAGWAGLCQDLHSVLRDVATNHPGLKVILFGHSMGSFAAQRLCLDHSRDIDAVVLSGSSSMDVMAQVMAESVQETGGGDVDLSAFNAAFEPARTPFDWLSRDEAEVDKYIESPLCGFDLQAESAATMFASGPYHGDATKISGIRSDLPVLLVAGDADPINGALALLHLLEQRWREGGVQNIETAYYEGGRHEMLNEINRDQVTTDIIEWMNRIVD